VTDSIPFDVRLIPLIWLTDSLIIAVGFPSMDLQHTVAISSLVTLKIRGLGVSCGTEGRTTT